MKLAQQTHLMKTNYLMLIALTTLPLTLAPGQTPDRFNAADANHDKTLWLDSETNQYLVAEIFKMRDSNKDGKITRAEWMIIKDHGQTGGAIPSA